MDSYIDSRFERLEKALTNLIDSVNKYHPSTVQAKELEAADEELTKGLEESTFPPFEIRRQKSKHALSPFTTFG